MRIPGFDIIRELGQGGFGVVYQAYAASGLQVAIKILKNPTDDVFRRFVHEAHVMSTNAANKHIVSIFSYDLNHNPPYIIMEYCDGGSLRSWIDQKRPWKDIAACLIHAARGLSTLHQLEGFHRDVKPDNLLLTNNPTEGPIIKLGDFGLSRIPTDTIPMTHNAAGTAEYMAPELLAREPMSAAADIYSLGITGIELLTGKRAVSSLKDVVIPKRFSDLLYQMTQSDSSKRPPASFIVKNLTDIFYNDDVATLPGQNNDSVLAGLLIGGVGVVLGGLGLVALAALDDKKTKNIKLKF